MSLDHFLVELRLKIDQKIKNLFIWKQGKSFFVILQNKNW